MWEKRRRRRRMPLLISLPNGNNKAVLLALHGCSIPGGQIHAIHVQHRQKCHLSKLPVLGKPVCVCVCVLHLVNSLSLDPREMTGPLLHDPVCTRCDLLSFSKSKLIQHFYWRGFTSPWSEVCPSLLYFPLSLCPSLIIRLDII